MFENVHILFVKKRKRKKKEKENVIQEFKRGKLIVLHHAKTYFSLNIQSMPKETHI